MRQLRSHPIKAITVFKANMTSVVSFASIYPYCCLLISTISLSPALNYFFSYLHCVAQIQSKDKSYNSNVLHVQKEVLLKQVMCLTLKS